MRGYGIRLGGVRSIRAFYKDFENKDLEREDVFTIWRNSQNEVLVLN